jgi:hypothetical protein
LEYLVRESIEPVNLMPVTWKEIKEINKSLKMKNSCCYDEVPAKIAKIAKIAVHFISIDLYR